MELILVNMKKRGSSGDALYITEILEGDDE